MNDYYFEQAFGINHDEPLDYFSIRIDYDDADEDEDEEYLQ